MNKADLVDAVSAKTGLDKHQASNALEAVLSTVSDALSQGTSVSLVGFGVFGERTCRSSGAKSEDRREYRDPSGSGT